MKKTRTSIQYIVATCLLMLGILFTFVIAHYRSRDRNFELIDSYINELSATTASHVEDVFADKLSAIKSIALLYGNAMDSEKTELELLAGLEENSGFDWIRFVAADGTDYTSDGVITNISDREYFKRGIVGNWGICQVPHSSVNGEKLIGFYAPVYYNDKICGIMVGFLSEKTVSDILDSSMYNYPADTYILSKDGTVIGSCNEEGTTAFSNISDAAKYISEQYKDGFISAIENQQNFQFIFRGSKGKSIGYIVPIKGTDWTLAQIFPSEATYEVMLSTHKDSVKSFAMITLIFAIFILVLLLLYRRNAKEKAEEIANNKINTLLRCVSEDYVYLINVDLETQQEVRYKLFSGDALEDWADGHYNYTYCIEKYADDFVAEYDRQRFIEATKLSVLMDVLTIQNNYYIEYDVVIDGNTMQYQGKFTISNEKPFENHMLISIRDITESARERIAREKELSEARRMAESASKAKSAFLFNMSHDIRTPMNAIIGYTNLIEMHLDDKEKLQNYIKKIKYSSDFLLSLINNVLEMSRIESGKLTVDETIWNVEQFNDMLISVFEEEFKQKNLKFTREINIIHEDVFCDALKLKEIYLNIISNAIKYTPKGGSINLKLEELPSDKEGYGNYRCVVSDTGIGMSEEFLTHIFEEFSRESTATESKVVGSGLGMPIVKRLVELMDGTITVESRLGEGTSFTVEIPHRIADRSKLNRLKDYENDSGEAIFSQKRILLAEDNDLNAEISEEILGGFGLKVERAVDGIDCVHKLQEAAEGYYDLILMDIQMPNMNGYDATMTIRHMDGARADIPIIAMTANAFDEDKKNALSAGMNGHISKPIEINKLLSTLKSMLKQ